jgi:peptide/nickel transport system substrate-binding protein
VKGTVRARTLGLLAIAALVLAVGASAETARVEASTTLLRASTTRAVTTWDPVKSFSTEVFYMANIYEGLVVANPPGSKKPFSPGLATNWGRSADGKTWTFRLRQNVKFTNGERLTSDAVKASIEAAAKRGGASFIWAPLDSIDTPSDWTVVFHLSYAAPLALIAASEYGGWIVCPEALKAPAATPNYFESGKTCGTGPYKLKSYSPGSQIVLEQNKDYWGGWKNNQFQNIAIQISPEPIVQQQALESGQVDLAQAVPTENFAKLAKNPKYTGYVDDASFNYVGFFNMTRPPLNNVLVRRALSYAMPYNDIVKIGAGGYGTRARSAVPKGIFPYNPTTPQYKQNLAKARELLVQSGHKGGGFTLNLTYAAENQAETRFAPLIKDAFKKVGVTVKVKGILFNQQWAAAKADPTKAQDIFLLLYWPTYSDAGSDNLWSMFHSSKKPFFNLSYWVSPAYDKLVDDAAAITATDRKGAEAEYAQAMKLLYQASPGFFLYDAQDFFVTTKSVNAKSALNINYPFVEFFYTMKKV